MVSHWKNMAWVWTPANSLFKCMCVYTSVHVLVCAFMEIKNSTLNVVPRGWVCVRVFDFGFCFVCLKTDSLFQLLKLVLVRQRPACCHLPSTGFKGCSYQHVFPCFPRVLGLHPACKSNPLPTEPRFSTTTGICIDAYLVRGIIWTWQLSSVNITLPLLRVCPEQAQ